MKDTQDENAEPRPDGPSPQQKAEAAKVKQDVGDEERSSTPDSRSEEVGDTESSADKTGESAEDRAGDELSTYPLREASEDARWAIRTVWIWTGFALASISFILTLLVLGTIYD
jgi:hypothetical protein